MASQMKLEFTGSIFLQESNPSKLSESQIQFYNIVENVWSPVTPIQIVDNKFTAEYNISLRISRNDLLSRALKDVISSGSVPSFRVLALDEKKNKLILSTGYSISIDDDNLVVALKFNPSWLLNQEQWINLNNTEFLAVTPISRENENSELSECQERTTKLENENTKISGDLASCQSENQTLSVQVTNLNTENQTLNDRIKELSDEIKDGNTKEYQDLLDLYNNLQSSFSDLQTTNNTLTVNNRSLTDNQELLTNKIDTLENQLNDCHFARTSLEEENQDLKNQLKQIESELSTCQSNSSDISDDLERQTQELSSLNNTLDSLRTEFQNAASENEQLKTELGNCRQNNTEGEANLASCEQEKTALQTELSDLKTRYNELAGRLSDDEKEKQNCLEIINGLRESLARTKEQFANCQIKLNQCKGKEEVADENPRLKREILDLRAQINKLVEDIKSLQKENSSLESQLENCQSFQNEDENPQIMKADKVYGGLIGEVVSAKDAMKGLPYQMGNVKMILKTVVQNTPAGLSFGMLDPVTMQDLPHDAISTVEIDINPNEVPEPTNIDPTGLPNLIGLTETAVRRKLALYGLKLDPIYETKEENSGFVIGQSFKQIPTAGSEIIPNQSVSVFFAKSKSLNNGQ